MPYLLAGFLTGVALLLFGLEARFASRAARPRQFRNGAMIAAIGLVMLWLLPWLAIAAGAADWELPLLILALAIAASVLGGGVTTMARGATARTESPAEQALDDLIQWNERAP